METLRVAGIDPGLRTTGFGIVNYCRKKNEVWSTNCGIVRTPDKIKGLDAILYMIKALRDISKRDCFKDCLKVAVEFPAAFYNPKFSSGSLSPLAAISGACMTLFQDETNEKIVPVYPAVWNGGKKKEVMAELIQDLIGGHSEWQFDNLPSRAADFEHVIDAVGMAYWLCDKEYFESSKLGALCNITNKTKSGLN
jgi:hypothetical protein